MPPAAAAYAQQTAPEDWALAAPMTGWRMRHAHGLEQLQAQMLRHFLSTPPLQPPQPAEPAEQPAAAAGGAAAQAPGQRAREQRLAALAAGQAALVAAFQAAEAAGENPVAAVHEAAQAAAANRTAAPAVGAQDAAPPAQEQPAQGGEPAEQQRFRAFTYLSQLQQALAYQTAVHQWRRGKADPLARVRVASHPSGGSAAVNLAPLPPPLLLAAQPRTLTDPCCCCCCCSPRRPWVCSTGS